MERSAAGIDLGTTIVPAVLKDGSGRNTQPNRRSNYAIGRFNPADTIVVGNRISSLDAASEHLLQLSENGQRLFAVRTQEGLYTGVDLGIILRHLEFGERRLGA
jgi:hypothetical protein